ncbi:MAG: putative bifunctional diguanylate cyclase/phosphodiesterase, partial [Actinomycetota bacterium]
MSRAGDADAHQVDPRPTPSGIPEARRRWWPVVLVVIVAALFLLVEAFVVRAYRDTARTTELVRDATDLTTNLANVQRESLLLLLETSAIEDARDLDDVRLQSGLLARQLSIFAARGGETYTQLLEDVLRDLHAFDASIGDLRAADSDRLVLRRKPEILEGLERIESQIKRVHDREEILLYDTLREDVERRVASQRLVTVFAALAIIIASALGFLLRLSIRRRFRRAYDALVVEVSERQMLEQQLRHQAFHDPLTNLANRNLFRHELMRAMSRSDRSGGHATALFIDLDGFKPVNDSLGHEAGDEVLRQVARRLASTVRPGDTVARLGGDEFAVVVETERGHPDAEAVCRRVLQEIERPMDIVGQTFSLTASVGVAVAEPGQQPEDVLRNADVAMYSAKATGAGVYRVFRPEMRDLVVDRFRLENELAAAIEKGQLRVHYQPIVDLASGRPVAVEALVRWEHPERGLLPPLEFIPVAEETGLVLALGRHVLLEATRTVAGWQRRHPEYRDLRVAVNLSGRQFEAVDLRRDVTRAIEESGIDPSSLILEVTESVMLHDPDLMVSRFRELRELGIVIAIDDFGTGFSALSYLRTLPADLLKIDRSFVQGIAEGERDSAIVRSMIELARTLG